MDIKKINLQYERREYLTDTVIQAQFQAPEDIEFQPGQFANILVAEKTWRSYSIVQIEGNIVHFIVDITPGGPGSKFFENSELGSEVEVLIPMGGFLVNKDSAPKVFIATGVGIAPFRSMIKEAFDKYSSEEVILLWGVRYDKDYCIEKIFGDLLEDSRLKVIPCITQSKGRVPNVKKERVTTLFPQLEIDFPNYELYVCGNQNMVVEILQIAKTLGMSKLHSEKY